MRFSVTQPLPGSVPEVLAALTDPAFLSSFAEVGKVGAPEILDRRVEGDLVHQRVRYRFQGHLSPAVTAVVDPAKLVWVDEHVYDLAAGSATFRILPEHYGDRLRCSGRETFVGDGDGDGSVRHAEGELTVRWPLVGRLVERAIVSGLQEHLEEEARLVRAWLDAAD